MVSSMVSQLLGSWQPSPHGLQVALLAHMSLPCSKQLVVLVLLPLLALCEDEIVSFGTWVVKVCVAMCDVQFWFRAMVSLFDNIHPFACAVKFRMFCNICRASTLRFVVPCFRSALVNDLSGITRILHLTLSHKYDYQSTARRCPDPPAGWCNCQR